MNKIFIFLFFLFFTKANSIDALNKQSSFFSSKKIVISCVGITALCYLYKKYGNNSNTKNNPSDKKNSADPRSKEQDQKNENLIASGPFRWKKSPEETIKMKIILQYNNDQKTYIDVGSIIFNKTMPFVDSTIVTGNDETEKNRYRMKLYSEAFKFHKDSPLLVLRTTQDDEEEKFLKDQLLAIEYGIGDNQSLGIPNMKKLHTVDDTQEKINPDTEKNDLIVQEEKKMSEETKQFLSESFQLDLKQFSTDHSQGSWLLIKNSTTNENIGGYFASNFSPYLCLYIKKDLQTENFLRQVLQTIFSHTPESGYSIYEEHQNYGIPAIFITDNNINDGLKELSFNFKGPEKQTIHTKLIKTIDNIFAVPIVYSIEKSDVNEKNLSLSDIKKPESSQDIYTQMMALLNKNEKAFAETIRGERCTIAKNENNEIVGFATYSKDKNDLKTIHIEMILVDKKYRHQNIATMIFHEIINLNQEIESILWQNLLQNTNATMIYTLLGAERKLSIDGDCNEWSLNTEKFLREHKDSLPVKKNAL